MTISACPPDSYEVIALTCSERADATVGGPIIKHYKMTYVVSRTSCTVAHSLIPRALRFFIWEKMYVKFANGSEAKASVPVNSGVFKSVPAAGIVSQ